MIKAMDKKAGLSIKSSGSSKINAMETAPRAPEKLSNQNASDDSGRASSRSIGYNKVNANSRESNKLSKITQSITTPIWAQEK
ncbi:hypothetical protein BFV93_4886 [Alteromonas macleodii]|nr:hypothetical protein BFV93_4886 [Alteromonas macleodii]